MLRGKVRRKIRRFKAQQTGNQTWDSVSGFSYNVRTRTLIIYPSGERFENVDLTFDVENVESASFENMTIDIGVEYEAWLTVTKKGNHVYIG